MRYFTGWLVVSSYIGLTLLGGCAGMRGQGPDAVDSRSLEALHSQFEAHPEDASAARNLGVAYLHRRQLDEARRYLDMAYWRVPDDPGTLFYLGLLTEMQAGVEESRVYYEGDADIPDSSPYYPVIKGRRLWISRELLREEMRMRIANNEESTGQQIDPLALAVLPLRFEGPDPAYAHLGRAFSDLVAADLAVVSSVNLVDRSRIRAVLDEMNVDTQDLADLDNSRRLGSLLGAGHLTGGTLRLSEDQGLLIDFASLRPALYTNPVFLRQRGRLSHFFDIEKEVVFALLQTINIELTPEEQELIARVPTQDMQAFLAYSRGLGLEDRGEYLRAAEAYNEAHWLDPTFERAGEAAERAGELAAGAGSASAILARVNDIEKEDVPVGSIDLLGLRMSNMTGAAMDPDERRQPAAEAASAVDPVLADPPSPPANN